MGKEAVYHLEVVRRANPKGRRNLSLSELGGFNVDPEKLTLDPQPRVTPVDTAL